MKATIYHKTDHDQKLDDSFLINVSFDGSESEVELDRMSFDVSMQSDLKLRDPQKFKELLRQLTQCFEIKEKSPSA